MKHWANELPETPADVPPWLNNLRPPMIADVIFPAFWAPYISPLLFPVAGISAITTEWFCYRHFSHDSIYPKLSDIILANLVSWFVGIIIGCFLPSGLIQKADRGGHAHLTAGPHFTSYAISAFFVACVLSIIIEFWTLRWSTRTHPIDHLFRLSAIANVTGYLVLGAVAWIWITWVW